MMDESVNLNRRCPTATSAFGYARGSWTAGRCAYSIVHTPRVGHHFSSTYVPGAGTIGGCALLPIDGSATNPPERGCNHSTKSVHQPPSWNSAPSSHLSALSTGLSFVQYPLDLLGGLATPAI